MTTQGRPRKACGVCKAQKIRCSGDHPSCKRCQRLRHACNYDVNPTTARGRKPLQQAHQRASLISPTASYGEFLGSSGTMQAGRDAVSAPGVLRDRPTDESQLGIPTALALTLAEAYFDNMYNAGYFLPRRHFLEALTAGIAHHHVVLSVCAWGANFYRDANGQATLKDNGSMIEWAKRAGRLVFQEIEDLSEENLVTFSNLALFWHSQGSWRISQLHKGNAYQTLYIMGLGPTAPRNENSLEIEIRRRRFWACYLMHCYSPERLALFEPIANMHDLPLPWPEEDFEAGMSRCPTVTLKSRQSNGGIFCELIRALTFWSSVVSSFKSKSDFGAKLTDIHTLDEEISSWWRNVQSNFKLSQSNITAVPHDTLPRIMLANLVYHQSLCALHASIVPLFCWASGEESWSTARQVSAQRAFDHASQISELISAVLSTHRSLSAMPNFVAYAAYCGCAIQIPFIWCLNQKIKERAQANVKANITMIHMMANYWKFAALLEVHVRCLYNIHNKGPTILEDEPKYLDTSKLTNFTINAVYARASILEFTGILRSKGDGYVKPGEETKDLGIQESSDIALSYNREQIQAQKAQLQQPHQDTSLLLPPQQVDNLGEKSSTLDIFSPFFDLEMTNIFSDPDMLDVVQFDTSLLNLDYLEMDGWNDGIGTNAAN
ncbi:hypothetical protein B0J13DRAFT_295137 [Dactylonectria estremocensis]|uniref:Zn(2)-C6 fungal-type domain-containing protein n=1 Tax=Dactylonectria estremocensis TaxID=1079267 RepID=A0A9P9F0T0_9HYPO|nr:hypothetical protein B0J13DRAFT_295137 [Dactylonectria estremocensis]